MLGLLNNTAYVVMNAGANEISEGGVALVYLCNVGPSLVVKMTLPYWAHLVDYRLRILIAGMFMVLAFSLVAFGNSISNLALQLIGVAFSAAQGGIGEASLLGLTAKYNPRTKEMLTAWSSGTGFAGVFGYAWKWFFNDCLGLPFPVSLMIGNILVIWWFVTFFVVLTPHSDNFEPGLEDLGASMVSNVSKLEIDMTFQ